MTAESLRDGALVGAGAIAVSVGTYLPWVRLDPRLPPDAAIPQIYFPGMDTGLEAFDLALLGVTGAVLLPHGVGSRRWVRPVVTLPVGVGIVLLCTHYLSMSSVVGVSALYIPAPGWYLTLLGGLLFTVAGGSRFPSILRRLEGTATPKN